MSLLSRLVRFFRPKPKVLVVPAPLHLELEPRDRVAIRDWLASPMTQRVLGIMESKHPGKGLPPMIPRNEWDAVAVACYHARIRGWELFRNQLLSVPEVPVIQTDPQETYPDQQ